MSAWARLYDFGYKHFTMPWEIGPRTELVQLVEQGRIRPCRAIDLGCGTGANATFLAGHGFDVTAVDFAPSAIAKARARAQAAGATVAFIVDDLTRLQNVRGPFDLLVDYGVLDDLGDRDRGLYVENVVPLCAPGARFLLWAFVWEPRWWERLTPGGMALHPSEVEHRFSVKFEIETLVSERMSGFLKGYAAYLMTRK